MGLEKSYVAINLTRPFIEDKLYYVAEKLDQIKIPWKVLKEDQSLIGINWIDWIKRRKSIETVLNRYLDCDMWEFKEYLSGSDVIVDFPETNGLEMILSKDKNTGRSITLNLTSFVIRIPHRSSIFLDDRLTPDFWDNLYVESINNNFSCLLEKAVKCIVSRELILPNTLLYKTLENLINRQMI